MPYPLSLNVYADFTFGRRPAQLDPIQKFMQPLTDDFMIIISPSVARDFAGVLIVRMLVRCVVVEARLLLPNARQEKACAGRHASRDRARSISISP
jgi:hypothetical protein